ncbi:MAG TPA: AraC family transcriptional regulator [Cyclobacteriaceae bacterium]
MDIFNLPNDIFPLGESVNDDIIFYDYEAKTGSFKGRSILHKNAISLVVKGEKTMHFAEKTVYINDNEFHFLSAGNCLASMNIQPGFIRSILVFFDNRILDDFYLKYNSQVSALRKKFKINPMPYISLAKDDFVRNYVESLILLLGKRNAISHEMKLLKFEELMLHLLERYPQALLSFRTEKKNSFDDLEIRKVIEANVTNTLSVDELAFLCNVSASTFKRRFTKIYGTSPNKWLLQRRMEIAANLLKHHKENPSAIFSKVGYDNHSSFSQSFKQIYGVTPKEFQLQS